MRSPLARLLRAVLTRRAGSAPVEHRSRQQDDRYPGDRYPGDFTGRLTPVYAPDPDGEPDPGEIVWTWVPYEEDHSRGKDRPVLLLGREGRWLLAVTLSSRDHDGGTARRRERWLDLGRGTWDARGRPSEVRLDRIVRVDPDRVRREGAVLDPERFDLVVRSLRKAWDTSPQDSW